MGNVFDLLIIGAGPAGLSAAYAAKQHGLDYIVIERNKIANTVSNFPLGKPLFSTPNDLEFDSGALRSAGSKPTREELLDYYHRFAEQEQKLRINIDESVESIMPGSPMVVKTSSATYRARAVLVAVGGMGIFNRLGVPGENAERVSYLFSDARPFRDRRVLVVGGGNSAAEAALYLCEGGAQVTFALRRPGLDPLPSSRGSAIKPWVRQPLEEAIHAGKIQAHFSARVLEIRSRTVLLETEGQRLEIECDHIFALIGARPDIKLLADTGVLIAADGRPEYNTETFETAIPNLYVAGHLTRELHMKQAISVPPRIVSLIANKNKTTKTQRHKD